MNNNDDSPSGFPGTIKRVYDLTLNLGDEPKIAEVLSEMENNPDIKDGYYEGMADDVVYMLRDLTADFCRQAGNDFFKFLPEGENERFARRISVIGNMPAETVLSDMLDAGLSREELQDVSVTKNIFVGSRTKKKEAVTVVAEAMLDPMRIMPYIFWSTPEEMATFFDMAASHTGYKIGEDDYLPFAFLEGGYIYPSGDGLFRIPVDVLDAVEKLWNDDELQNIYDSYIWLQDCLDAAAILYGLFPVHILTTLYNLSHKYKSDNDQILEMLLTQPRDYAAFTVNGECVYEKSERGHLPHMLTFLNDAPYFVPTLEALEAGNFITTPAKIVNSRLFDFVCNILRYNPDEATELVWELNDYRVMGLEGHTDYKELIDELTCETSANNRKRLQKIINELDPFLRKMCNHGFTDGELANIKKEQAKSKNKIVVFDELRRKKKKKGGN